MKKGIAAWNYGENYLENTPLMHECGFDAVSYLGRHFDAHTAAQDEETARLVRRYGLTLTIHHKMPDPDDDAQCAAFPRAMAHIAAFAEKYGVLYALTFDFNFPHDRLLPYTRLVLETFRGSGVVIAMEDTPLNARRYEKFLPLLTAKDRFGILIDAGHMNVRHTWMEENEPDEIIAALRALPVPIVEVHLSGNRGRRDEHGSLIHTTLPMGAFVQGLKETGFDGIATIERVPHDEPLAQSLCAAQADMRFFTGFWNPTDKE